MQEQENALDLGQYRRKKQKIAEEHIGDLYRKAHEYALKETNIREKVRAKMIFSKRFLQPVEARLSQRMEALFQEWFLFDYKTIKGQTLFFQYLQTHPLHESTKLLGAVVLTAAWEPVIVREMEGETVRCQTIMQSEEIFVKVNLDCIKKEMIEGEAYFVRKVPLVIHQWILGPVFPVKSMDTVANLKTQYGQMNQKTGVLWRTFLKEEAPNFILPGLS
ncbi:hypothetical protein CN378_02505 [Bacillus sp. AFS015802]|uniref:hypothetical protein n=1 Tax=Bacillus sp. AFS015802 TaxID=2033486 RepID=UPI000BF7F9F1|nr:hypothetical protein [Bacillus sp. AFS015802]PFA69659.1 hypothetical protein CN378_02505 [Bacillus sp. AFS015802]